MTSMRLFSTLGLMLIALSVMGTHARTSKTNHFSGIAARRMVRGQSLNVAKARTSASKLHQELEELSRVHSAESYRLQKLEEAKGEYNRWVNVNVLDAMPLLHGIGANFVVCVEQEVAHEKWYGRLGIAFEIASSILLGPIVDALKAAVSLANGEFAEAADHALSGVAHALHDPTKLARDILAAVLDDTNPHYAMCATCATALAWGIARNRAMLDEDSPRDLAHALGFVLALKDGTGERRTCELSRADLSLIESAARGRPRDDQMETAMEDALGDALLVDDALRPTKLKVIRILAQLVRVYIRYIEGRVRARFVQGLTSPFSAMANTKLTHAQHLLSSVLDPSTEYITPKDKGGWMVEDLNRDYFERGYLEYDPDRFTYRYCQKVCDMDVRTAGRSCHRMCTSEDCTIL